MVISISTILTAIARNARLGSLRDERPAGPFWITDQWDADNVETHLPYHDVVANDLDFRRFKVGSG
jgi:hypothetical protein